MHTSLSSAGVQALPSRAKRFRFSAKPHSFIFSYVMNWIAPFETPNIARDVPRQRPRTPSVRAIVDNPSIPNDEHYTAQREKGGALHMLRYAAGSSARLVNIRTLTTQIGFVITAVTAPAVTQERSDRSDPEERWFPNSLARSRAGTTRPRAACSDPRPSPASSTNYSCEPTINALSISSARQTNNALTKGSTTPSCSRSPQYSGRRRGTSPASPPPRVYRVGRSRSACRPTRARA